MRQLNILYLDNAIL